MGSVADEVVQVVLDLLVCDVVEGACEAVVGCRGEQLVAIQFQV